jgi:hypothetical protein
MVWNNTQVHAPETTKQQKAARKAGGVQFISLKYDIKVPMGESDEI